MGTTWSRNRLFQPWVISKSQLINASSTSDVLGLSIFSSGICYWRVLIKNSAHRDLPLKQSKDNLEENYLCRRHFPPRNTQQGVQTDGLSLVQEMLSLQRLLRVPDLRLAWKFLPQGINYFQTVLVLTGAGDSLSPTQRTKISGELPFQNDPNLTESHLACIQTVPSANCILLS